MKQNITEKAAIRRKIMESAKTEKGGYTKETSKLKEATDNSLDLASWYNTSRGTQDSALLNAARIFVAAEREAALNAKPIT